jgi:hypothetical protein
VSDPISNKIERSGLSQKSPLGVSIVGIARHTFFHKLCDQLSSLLFNAYHTIVLLMGILEWVSGHTLKNMQYRAVEGTRIFRSTGQRSRTSAEREVDFSISFQLGCPLCG